MYEKQVERRDTAIRSMYRMWHGTKALRKELLAFGLTEAQAALAFQDYPYPSTEQRIFDTIQRCPAIVPVAEKLVAEYIRKEWRSRKEFYQPKGKPDAEAYLRREGRDAAADSGS